MRYLCALILLAASSQAAVLPGAIGPWKQVSVQPLPAQKDQDVWSEYGLTAAEQATYSNGGKTLTATAWRLADATGAQGAFLYLLPPAAKPLPAYEALSSNSAAIETGALVALGNYLVRFEGAIPDIDSAADIFRSMPRYESSGLPTFTGYLPADRRVANSVRYIEGPAALRTFFPGLDPSVAAFHLGAEAVVADYADHIRLALFSYPTPAIARHQAEQFSKISKAIVKRSGPLVAVVLNPKNTNAAETVLAKVRYQAVITTGERLPRKSDNPGNLMLNIALLILVLSVFCLLSGILFGVLRYLLRRGGASGDGDEMITLHLSGR